MTATKPLFAVTLDLPEPPSLQSKADLNFLPPPPPPPATSKELPSPESGNGVIKRLKTMAQSLVSLTDHKMVTRKKSHVVDNSVAHGSSMRPKKRTMLTATTSASQLKIKRKSSSVTLSSQKKRLRLSAPNIQLTKFSAISSPVLRSKSK